MQEDPAPLTVLDTHAGAGIYDLHGEGPRRTGEAEEGVVRLLAEPDPPAVFGPLKAAVAALNPTGAVRLYPGSPALVAPRLRPEDRYVGCELRADDHAALAASLAPYAHARALRQDGYAMLAGQARRGPRQLTLVDPPFERGDDYANTAQAVGQADGRPGDVFLVWTPLKDLETFDSFLGRLIGAGAETGLVVEARLRPLDDPLRMNGCALVVLAEGRLLEALRAPAKAAASWVVERLGRAGGLARVEPLA